MITQLKRKQFYLGSKDKLIKKDIKEIVKMLTAKNKILQDLIRKLEVLLYSGKWCKLRKETIHNERKI